MSDYTDPVQKALEKARQRGQTVVDQPSGIAPHVADPFNSQSPKIPIPYNSFPASRSAQAFEYQQMSGPDTMSLHSALPPEKQAEYAEAMLKQQIEQNNLRFEREMEKEAHKVSRSRLLVLSLVKMVKWSLIVLLAGLVSLISVLAVTGWKAGSLSDTSILNAIVNFLATVIGALATSSTI